MKALLGFLVCGVIFQASQALAMDPAVAEYVPRGHKVVEDNLKWTCPEFTEDEKREIAAKGDDIPIHLGYGSGNSCILRDEEGNLAAIRNRGVLPGSKLLTYDPAQNISTEQEWSSSPGPLKTYSLGSAAIQLPTLTLTIVSRSWEGEPSADPLK